MGIEATTDGEKMIQLDGKIDLLNNNMENVFIQLDRVLKALEKLETTKVTDHEQRITKIERWQSEFSGVYKVVIFIAALLSSIAIIYTYLKP